MIGLAVMWISCGVMVRVWCVVIVVVVVGTERGNTDVLSTKTGSGIMLIVFANGEFVSDSSVGFIMA